MFPKSFIFPKDSMFPKNSKLEKTVYERVADEETASSDNLLQEGSLSLRNHSKWRLSLLFARKALLISLAAWGIVSLGFQIHKSIESKRKISCDCGASIAEALTLDCKYDTMAAAWLPPACRDDELSAEFDRNGPGPGGQWYYWKDPNRKHELTITELSMLADTGEPFFTEWSWHVAHCTYYWRKQDRGKAYIDSSARYGHIVHCEEVILGDQEATIMSGIGLNTTSYQ